MTDSERIQRIMSQAPDLAREVVRTAARLRVYAEMMEAAARLIDERTADEARAAIDAAMREEG